MDYQIQALNSIFLFFHFSFKRGGGGGGGILLQEEVDLCKQEISEISRTLDFVIT